MEIDQKLDSVLRWFQAELMPSLGPSQIQKSELMRPTPLTDPWVSRLFTARKQNPGNGPKRELQYLKKTYEDMDIHPGFGLEWRTDYDPLRGQIVNSGLNINGRLSSVFLSVGHNHVRSVPVLSPSANQLYYAAALTPILGVSGGATTGAYMNVSAAVASASRSGNLVTLNLAQRLPSDMNGLPMTISEFV